ncbi:hypothetical protein [Candidatus Sororendozoicomonas aggregata]|uniref:hypothetical protein n=1 Tax=Candidatus Sororendozoicomonas aggregata TaxID=3073239 RepID=UPI002ED3D60F
MHELPTLKNLCLDKVVESSNKRAFEQLPAASDIQHLYLKHIMFAFFGGNKSAVGYWRDGGLIPDMEMTDRVREMLKENCPITFPYLEMKDRTLYIHGLGCFGINRKDEYMGHVYADCQYLILGTKETRLYALVCDHDLESENNATPDYLPCNYNVFRLSDYNDPCVELDSIKPDYPGHLACLMINGFPCTARVDYHDCTLTLS